MNCVSAARAGKDDVNESTNKGQIAYLIVFSLSPRNRNGSLLREDQLILLSLTGEITQIYRRI
jgi:hypothetical protein